MFLWNQVDALQNHFRRNRVRRAYGRDLEYGMYYVHTDLLKNSLTADRKYFNRVLINKTNKR